MAARFGGLVLALAGGGVMATLGTARAQTQVYDAVADFSLNSNPNGVWSYVNVPETGAKKFRLPTTQLYGVAGWNAWTKRSQGKQLPAVARNMTGSPITYGSIVAPTNELMLNPSYMGAVVIYFRAPAKGLYRIDATFEGIAHDEYAHGYQISAKHQFLAQGGIGSFGQIKQYHGYLTMKKGELITFVCGGALGFHPPKSATGLALTIKGPVQK